MIDPFFIGDETARAYDRKKARRNHSDQVIGIHELADFRSEDNAEGFEIQDDLSEFSGDPVDLDLGDAKKYEEVFLVVKSRMYGLYGFLDIKSKSLGNVPVRERDLLLGEEDAHLIQHLAENVTDYFVVEKLAVLMACKDMRIEFVRFVAVDNCGLCNAMDGVVYRVRDLISKLCNNDQWTHAYCDARLVPVINRFAYRGPLTGSLDIDLVLGKTTFLGVPKELLDDLKLALADVKVPEGVYRFTDANNYLDTRGLDSDEVPLNTVVFSYDGETIVHNSYVQSLGPVDFLKFHLTQIDAPQEELADIRGGERFYMSGQVVYLYNGSYWTEDGKRVE